MPKLKVDGIEVKIPAGATVLQAWQAAAKKISLFCDRRTACGGGGKRAALGLLAGCLFLVPAFVAASAQAQAGWLLPDRTAAITTRDISPYDRARQTMNDYAVCVVKKEPAAARGLLSLHSDADINVALQNMAIDDCLQAGTLRMSSELMRGAVFRALYLHDYGRTPPRHSAVDSPNARPDETVFRTFARCVAVVDEGDVRALVLSTPATPNEKRAIAGLRPALARCVPPSNQFRLNAAVLQGSLAEAAYRQATLTTAVIN